MITGTKRKIDKTIGEVYFLILLPSQECNASLQSSNAPWAYGRWKGGAKQASMDFEI